MRTILVGPLLLFIGLGFGSGCAYPVRGAAWDRLTFDDTENLQRAVNPPRIRLGSMPFYYAHVAPINAVGPDDLAPHRFRRGGWFSGFDRPTDRGTLYGTRCGFLDIAHVRNAIDLTYYVYRPIRTAIDAGGDTTLELMSIEPDVFRVTLGDTRALNPADRHALANAIAGRIAYLMSTWHEIATWFGYKGMTPLISERPSAFSYDDAPSHMIGVLAAMDALDKLDGMEDTDDTDRFTIEAFNIAVTQTLNHQLETQGAMAAPEVRRRALAVKGDWWGPLSPKVRLVHMGLTDEPMEALIVDESILTQPVTDPTVSPTRWVWSSSDEVAGRAVDDWYRVAIQMNLWEARTILTASGRAIEGHDHVLIPHRDFPRLRETMLEAGTP